MPRSREDLYWRWKVPVQLPPTNSGRRIGTVKGQFGVAVGPPGMDIVIADLTGGGNPIFEWDSVVVTVASVRQSGDQYVVEGDMSAPSGSPMAKAMLDKDATDSEAENARGKFEYFGLLDATGNAMRREVKLGPIRSEGDRDVIRWTLTTMDPTPLAVQLRTPGVCFAKCVPAALRWSAPETRWFMVPFELRF